MFKTRKQHKLVIAELITQLQEIQKCYARALHDAQVNTALEQVLLDTILQLDVVLAFRHEMQPYIQSSDSAEADEQPDHMQQEPFVAGQKTSNTAAAGAAPSRYVTYLVSQTQPSTVQQVLNWRVQDWIEFLRDTAPQLSLLLQMTTGSSSGYLGTTDASQAAPHLLLASQQLSKAVDDAAIIGLIGAIYGDMIGQQLGTCTSLNLLTMQQEAPPQHHWQHVLLQLQPTEQQLLQLAAGHVLFKRLCTADQKAQRAVAHAVSAANSCSLLVLTALSSAANNSSTCSGSSSGDHSSCSDAAHASADKGAPVAASVLPVEHEVAAPANGSMETAAAASAGMEVAAAASGDSGSTPCESGEQGPAAASDEAAAGAGGEQQGAAAGTSEGLEAVAAEPQAAAAAASDAAHTPGTQPADPVSSMESLLRRLTHTSGLMHMLMLNTLTREQIARVVVVSSPFAPRPAPIMEAAHLLVQQGHDWQQSMWMEAAGDEPQLLGGWLAAAPRPGTQEHSDERTQLLRQQVHDWWSMAPGR